MEVGFNPSLEIDPRKFVLVVGPQFTAAVLDEVTREPAAQSKLALTSRQLVSIGISLLLESNEFQSDAERVKCDTLYRNAYELDPLFAVKKLSSSLQKNGQYAEWLKRAYAYDVELFPTSESPSLKRVRHLQQGGALVVYTHYDDVLCRMTMTKPVLLSDYDGFGKWCRGEIDGILHLHGVYSKLDTVVFDSDAFQSPSHPATSQLSAVFGNRHMLMIGFDSEKHNEDPLLTKFLERYIAETPPSLHTFHLTRAENPIDLSCVHKISVLCTHEAPTASLLPLSSTSQAMWRQIELPHTNPNSLTLGLLCNKKEDASEISQVIGDGPGVTFAIVSSITHNSQLIHTVSLRVLKSKEKELWNWLVDKQRGQLLTKGLLAVVLHSGTFLWMRGRPHSDFDCCTMDSNPPPLIHTTHSPHTSPTTTDPADRPFSPFRPKEEAHSPEFTFPKSTARKVPRYTMHQIRPRHQPYPTGGGSTLGKHGRVDIPLFGQVNSRALHHERRASLPVNSIHNSNTSHALEQLAHNLIPTQSHDPPSYAAIKQALLCDWYKRRRSIQVDPKTLKFLLKSKLINEPLDLLKLRRYSDPGSYISQPESFARRKELFIDENRTWSSTYGKVIEQKIAKWRLQREEKQRREMLEFAGLKYHLLNPLQSNGIPSNSPHMFQPGLAQAGINSYVYPPTIYASVSSAMQSPPHSSMLYSPYIAPYTVVSPYQSYVQVGQPTVYIPQPATLPSQQKLVYLVPPTSGSISSPYATLNGSTQHLKVGGTTLTRKKSDSNLHDSLEEQQLRDMYKRRQSVPVNLSSLLVSPLTQFGPDSPPPAKKMHLSEEPPLIHATPPPTNTASPQQSPKQLSSRQHHLLRVHRTSHHRNGENGYCRSSSHSPVPSPHSVGLTSNFSPMHVQSGNYFVDSDGSEFDETEAERIVGGATMSSSQPGLGGPTPHSQLQLWQFLLELLLISANTRLIQWSSNEYEFQINNPTGVAELWGKVTNNDSMDYSKLLKGLCYYSRKGLMSKVEGKEDSFRYNSCIQSYIETRRSSIATNQEEMVVVE